MSARVAYFERADRGQRPVGVRIVGERTDESVRCAEGAPIAALSAAAAWLLERLPKRPGSTRPLLDVLCIDVDGALCSWLTAPSPEAGVVNVLARQSASDWASGADDADAPSARPPAVLSGYAGMPGEAAVQALAAPVRAERVNGAKGAARVEAKLRVPVLAVPDAPARVLIDALDDAGVRVDRVCSLWHAMAAAWDPAGPAGVRALGPKPAEAAGRVVAESTSPVSASVLVDTAAGRMLWTWSRGGALIAAGSMRVRTDRLADGTPGAARLRARDASRLATEWLAWSAQLALAPSRLTCVTPELGTDESADTLDAAGLGVALGRALPGATVDLAVDEDPIGTTLRRVAAGVTAAEEAGATGAPVKSDPTAELTDLSRRPGQAHFRLNLWAALAITMAAAGLGALAWKFRSDAGALRDAARTTMAQAREFPQAVKLPPIFPGKELETVLGEVSKLERETAPVKGSEPNMPVLRELETLSMVLQLEEFDLDTVTVDSVSSAKVVVLAPSLEQGERLFAALRAVGGSFLADWTSNFTPMPASGKIRCTFSAVWSAEARKGVKDGAK